MKEKLKHPLKLCLVILTIVSLTLTGAISALADDVPVLESRILGTNAEIFVKKTGEAGTVTAKVGQEDAPGATAVSDPDMMIVTWLLLDNSISIPQSIAIL